jgi:putative phosphoribosyl transferase
VVVLALPRGGVPVGFEVARALNAPLDVMLVRKLGLPEQEELAMGAVASGGVRVINENVIRELKISDEVVEKITHREMAELEQQESRYRRGRPALDVDGRIVILVDDGLATGSTMRAAIEALRHHSPQRIVVGVPVGAVDTCSEFHEIADEVICAASSEEFLSVGSWYADFSQTTDEAVEELLERSNRLRARPAESRSSPNPTHA